MRLVLKLAAVAAISLVAACEIPDPCMDLASPAAQQECINERAVRLAAMGSGGGGFRNVWAGSPLVDDDGNVILDDDEEKVDHPSTDPDDFGFSGDGPPSIDS